MKKIIPIYFFIIFLFTLKFFDFASVNILSVALILFITLFVQMIIHELGHLIFGLLTKYKLVSFQILFLKIIKNEKIKLTFDFNNIIAGQCLMEPPKKDNNSYYPYFWHLIGGIVLNLIVVLVAFPFVFKTSGLLSFSLYSFSFIGLMIAILNGIPFNDKIPNDGKNLINIINSIPNKEAYYLQLCTNALLNKGFSYQEIDTANFVDPKYSDIDSSLMTVAKMIEYNYYCYKLDFYNAFSIISYLFNRKEKLNYFNEIISLEYIFMLILLNLKQEATNEVLNLPKPIIKYLSKSKDLDKKEF